MIRKIAFVGLGRVSRDRHVAAIAASPDFDLASMGGPGCPVDGAESYPSLDALLAIRSDISCVSFCMPPQVSHDHARRAIESGRHVMLDCPPGATLGEIHELASLAASRNVTLFAAWGSRLAPAVAPARTWLLGEQVRRVDVRWKEDARQDCAGQDWHWRPGGLGVFGPGLDALAILTRILPRPLHLTEAALGFPQNRQTPISARLTFSDDAGADVRAGFDWRADGPPERDIHIETATGYALLNRAGARLSINGAEAEVGGEVDPDRAYRALYARFAHLISSGQSDVDLAPLRHVADAFILGRRIAEPAFHW